MNATSEQLLSCKKSNEMIFPFCELKDFEKPSLVVSPPTIALSIGTKPDVHCSIFVSLGVAFPRQKFLAISILVHLMSCSKVLIINHPSGILQGFVTPRQSKTLSSKYTEFIKSWYYNRPRHPNLENQRITYYWNFSR